MMYAQCAKRFILVALNVVTCCDYKICPTTGHNRNVLVYVTWLNVLLIYNEWLMHQNIPRSISLSSVFR